MDFTRTRTSPALPLLFRIGTENNADTLARSVAEVVRRCYFFTGAHADCKVSTTPSATVYTHIILMQRVRLIGVSFKGGKCNRHLCCDEASSCCAIMCFRPRSPLLPSVLSASSSSHCPQARSSVRESSSPTTTSQRSQLTATSSTCATDPLLLSLMPKSFHSCVCPSSVSCRT